jgi:hypothetical protein
MPMMTQHYQDSRFPPYSCMLLTYHLPMAKPLLGPLKMIPRSKP